MSEDLITSFDVKGVRVALQSFKALTAAANEAAAAQANLTRAGGSVVTAPRQRAAPAQANAGGREVGASTPSAFTDRLTAAMDRLGRMAGDGSPSSTPGIRKKDDPITQLVKGVGKEELIGKLIDRFMPAGGAAAEGGAAEGLAALGGVGIAIAGVVAVGAVAIRAAAALEELSARAAAAGSAFGGLQFGTGGTTRETADLSVLGRMGGLSPGQMAGMASTLQNRITSDPVGMAVGGRLGVHNLPGVFGDQDQAGQLLKVISALRMEDRQSQVRDARALGLDTASPLLRMSGDQYALGQKDVGLTSRIMNPKFQTQSADFQASIGRVATSIENLMSALAPAVIDDFTGFFNGLADAINSVTGFIARNQAALQIFSDTFAAMGSAAMGNYSAALQHIENITSGKDDLTQALKDNTQATQQNTAGVGQPGVYGNISRDIGGLPAFGYGAIIRLNSDQKAYRLGIYG